MAEANAEKETLVTSEGYKGELEKLSTHSLDSMDSGSRQLTTSSAKPPLPIATVVSKKSEEAKGKEVEKKDEPEAEATTSAVQDKKSRSQSRKRSSIFGGFLGKKEEGEKKEEKKPEAEETPTAEASTAAEVTTPVEPAVEGKLPKP